MSLSHRPRGPRYSFFEDRRLSAPRSDGPPAPLRLEQPSPRTSPISDAPLSPLGHRLAGSRTDGQLARRPCCHERLALTRATETVTLPHLAELQERRSGRLPPCRDRPGFPPGRRALLATWFGSVARLAHRSRLEAAAVCVSTPFGEPLGQRRVVDSPCGSSSVATRDASDQFLPSHVFVRAPVPRRLPTGRTLARPPSEIPSASRQNESLRWVSRGPSSGFHRVGRCRPVAMRENRTSDTPVASCPEPVELALLTLSNRPPRPP